MQITAYGNKTRAQQLLRWATVSEQSGPKTAGLLCSFPWGQLGPHLTQYRLAEAYLTDRIDRQDRQDNGPVAQKQIGLTLCRPLQTIS